MTNNYLFTGINSGLTSAYSLISNAYSGNVSLANISSAMTNTGLTSTLNQTFASYIQSNFSSLDTNRDGKLSSAELSALTTKISTQGLTAAQMSQLGTASGLSGAALAEVLDHFSDIDANKDGKVTSAEISAYKVTSAEQLKKIEFANKAATNMSVFYGDDSSSSADSSSLVSYKYLNSGGTSSSSSSGSSNSST